jgi:hypothetical protein
MKRQQVDDGASVGRKRAVTLEDNRAGNAAIPSSRRTPWR